jgi:hypothetical protein
MEELDDAEKLYLRIRSYLLEKSRNERLGIAIGAYLGLSMLCGTFKVGIYTVFQVLLSPLQATLLVSLCLVAPAMTFTVLRELFSRYVGNSSFATLAVFKPGDYQELPWRPGGTAAFNVGTKRIQLSLTKKQASELVGQMIAPDDALYITWEGDDLLTWRAPGREVRPRREVGVSLFLSYAHEDAQKATFLEEFFRKRGIGVVRDLTAFKTGDPLTQVIKDRILRAKYFMCCEPTAHRLLFSASAWLAFCHSGPPAHR